MAVQKLLRIKPKKTYLSFKRSLPIYLMLLPGFIYLMCNNYMPMFGLLMAFKNLNFKLGILGSPWSGLDNFKFLFQSGDALMVTRNTILYNIVFIILGTILGVFTAVMMNEIRKRTLKTVFQTLILLPYLMSMVVVSYFAYAFLSTESGFINNTILPLFGVTKSIQFYQEEKYWPFIIVFFNMWKGIGFGAILYLSTLIGISPEYYEAAKIDGANRVKQFIHITLPGLKTTMITLFILSLGYIFRSDFGLFYQLPRNSGMLYQVTETIDVYVYNMLMNQSNYALSSAASFYQSIVGFLLIIAANAFIKKLSPDDSMF